MDRRNMRDRKGRGEGEVLDRISKINRIGERGNSAVFME